jgi:putative aminopeptidase FrvX
MTPRRRRSWRSRSSRWRATGTDADAVHVSRTGVPTGIVSIPIRYMHSPVELVSLADIQVAAELIAAFAKRLEPGMSFQR